MQPGLRREYSTTINYTNASNRDIIRTIESNYPKAVEQTKEFAKQFRGESTRETAYNVWKFLRKYITYKKDSNHAQIVQLPSWFINEATGDCKSYSLLAASLLANLGLPVAFRYASYAWLNPVPSHVYVVTWDENGKEVIVDGVWPHFNSEKKPAYKQTRKMDVITMAGTDNELTGIGKRKKGGILRFGKKLALAPNRRAFRTIVSLNLFGLARKLQKTRAKNPSALRKLWEQKLGGKYSELEKSIKKGYNHWAKRHKKQRISGIECAVAGDGYFTDMERNLGLAGIGALPALAAVVAAAAPLTAAVAPLIKKSGADKTEPGEPPMDQAVTQSQQMRRDNPTSDSQMTVAGLEIGLAIGKAKKKKGRFARGVKKIALAPNRRAFRTIVSLNAGGLAYKLARVNKKDAKGLKADWEKLGGSYPDLLKSIKVGLRKVPAKKRRTVSGLDIGAAAPASGDKAKGIVALATTIIKALSSLFKKHGEAGEQMPGETTFEKVLNVADSAATEFGTPKESAIDLLETGQADAEGNSSDEPGEAGFSIAPALGIAAALGLLLLFK